MPILPYIRTRSQYIESREEAEDYYRERLARPHQIQCRGVDVTIAFERQATHLYSVAHESDAPIDPLLLVRRQIAPYKFDDRVFSLERARLMDEVLRAITFFTVSTPGTGTRGRENRMLHGSALPDGRYMRVILRPGPGDAHTVVSAYPVTHDVWMQQRRAKKAKFPP